MNGSYSSYQPFAKERHADFMNEVYALYRDRINDTHGGCRVSGPSTRYLVESTSKTYWGRIAGVVGAIFGIGLLIGAVLF